MLLLAQNAVWKFWSRDESLFWLTVQCGISIFYWMLLQHCIIFTNGKHFKHHLLWETFLQSFSSTRLCSVFQSELNFVNWFSLRYYSLWMYLHSAREQYKIWRFINQFIDIDLFITFISICCSWIYYKLLLLINNSKFYKFYFSHKINLGY